MTNCYSAALSGQLQRSVGDGRGIETTVTYASLLNPDGTSSPLFFKSASETPTLGFYGAVTADGTFVIFDGAALPGGSPLRFKPAGVYLPYTGKAKLVWSATPASTPSQNSGFVP